MIIEKSNYRFRNVEQLLTSQQTEVTINQLNGLPDYNSQYLEFRDLVGLNILESLMNSSARSSLNIETIWDLRSDFPIAACLNVHTVCNEACIMCPYDNYSKINDHLIMPDVLFERLMNEFVSKGGKILTFNNFSDIFAHTSGIIFIEKALEYSSLQLYIVTNGLNMNPAYIDRILSKGFAGITYVSCHGFSQETFKKVTRRDAFYTVINNIKYLAENHPYPERIIVQYAADYSSIEEVIQAQKYWSSLKVNLNLFNTHTFAGNSQHCQQDSHSGILAGCRGWGHDAGQPFYQIVIQANGDVTLCCHDLANSVILGNVAKNSIYEVWNSEQFYTVVGQIYMGHDSKKKIICRKCQLAQYVQ